MLSTAESEGAIERKLFSGEVKARLERITEAEFLWQHHRDPMRFDKKKKNQAWENPSRSR
ncbi:hypothetical protein KCP76_13490 [Salmonella enterica subsp. enterica serovar Weltevreden]|nr:hypothetical protein KCP76_13490 [Salmonella enterica subsp. enterica serovar Weltevreden]